MTSPATMAPGTLLAPDPPLAPDLPLVPDPPLATRTLAQPPSRTLVLWCPDWPVVAALRERESAADAPAMVFGGGRVQVASAAARAEGIRTGMRKREAQSRCPSVLVLAADPERDARLFEPVALAVEALAPGIEVLRPGLLACRVRGPARYFGSEIAAAERLVDAVEALDIECRVGIAGGLSTAVLAARRSVIVPADGPADSAGVDTSAGGSPGPSTAGAAGTTDPVISNDTAFCAGLSIDELVREPALARPSWAELAGLLRRLGVTTAGALAALPAEQVAARFGTDGVALHRLAGGGVEREVSRRRIDADLMVEQRCDPPLDRVDAAAFAARAVAERFHTRLAAAGVACTRLAITAVTERGEELHRVWRCTKPLSAADTADRLRWQLDGWLTARGLGGSRGSDSSHGPDGSGNRRGPHSYDPDTSAWEDDDARRSGGLTLLRLEAVEAVDAGRIQYGLWGAGGLGEDRARAVFARVQGLLGPDAVRSATLSGGRGPVDRIATAAWGEQNTPPRDPDAPWPGALPAPSPALPAPSSALVAPAQREALPPADVTSRFGRPIAVTERGMLTEVPAAVGGRRVISWAGPWLFDERWWSGPAVGSAAGSDVRRAADRATNHAAHHATGRTDRLAASLGPRARIQVVTEAGPPVLLGFGARGWQVEAVYD